MARVVKNLPASAEDVRDRGSIPRVERFPWRRSWQLTPLFLPGESHGQKSLVGYSPKDHKESDKTKHTTIFHDFLVSHDPVGASLVA